MTEPAPSLVAARRRRVAADRAAVVSRAEPGRSTLRVLLPSADAATIVLQCDLAAELVGPRQP